MIRKANKNDIYEIVRIEKELFSDNPWPNSAFIYEMEKNPFAQVLVYEEDNTIAGYLDIWITFEKAQIANIAVRKAYQGKGIGQALLDEAIKIANDNNCENVSLEVRVGNEVAINLYEKNEFINVATRKHYYENGDDAYLMVKALGGGDDTYISD